MALSAAAGGARVLLETTRRQMTALFRSRHGGHITLSTGFDAEGRFLARTVDVVFEAGPYDGHSSTVSRHAAMAAAQLYPRGVVSARSRAVATNRLPGGAFRGYGCIQSGFAVETHVDEIARLVGLDPYRIRLLNVARTGDPDPTSGVPFRDVKATECLTQLQESDRSAELDPTVGRGVAVVVATSAAAGPAGPDRAEVACRWDPHTGTVVIETAVADVGQGMTILLSQLAAEVLGIDESRVAVEIVARNRGIRDPGMFGSRGANVTGSALVRAAGELKRALIKQAASRIGLTSAAEDAQIDPGWEVIHFASDSVKLSELDEVRTVGAYETSDSGLAWGAVRVLARCDETTGQVELVQVASVHDVGVLLDELGARGQVHGGVVQGIGAALSERASFLADGSVAETGFLNHLIPTNAALPETIIGFLPSPARPDGRTGAKGIGEAAIMGVPAAIANAVADVTGAPMRQLPLTPERVLRALKADHARRVEAR
jgi:CO/xanthine dehydrogenase Mo-binding subunit